MKTLLPILFVIIAGGVFFGFINPTYQEVKTLGAQASVYDQALTKSKELQTVRDELLARYNTFSQSDLERLQKLVPDTVDTVRLILDLDDMAAKYGMHVRNVGLTTNANEVARAASGKVGTGNAAYDSLVLTFTVSGTYATFRTFLMDLEQSLRLVDVTGISFTSSPNGLYEYTVTVRTYWLKPSTTL